MRMTFRERKAPFFLPRYKRRKEGRGGEGIDVIYLKNSENHFHVCGNAS